MTDRTYFGTVSVDGVVTRRAGVIIHFTSGSTEKTSDGRTPPTGAIENSLFWLMKRNNGTANLGYQSIVYDGTVYELAEPLEVTAHSSGENRSHIGLAFKHEGLRTRAIAGQTVPAINRRNGAAMFQRVYDARDLEAMARHAANLLREHCPDGDILFHDDLDYKKNDPGPAFPRSGWAQAVRAWVVAPDVPFDFRQFLPEGFDYST